MNELRFHQFFALTFLKRWFHTYNLKIILWLELCKFKVWMLCFLKGENPRFTKSLETVWYLKVRLVRLELSLSKQKPFKRNLKVKGKVWKKRPLPFLPRMYIFKRSATQNGHPISILQNFTLRQSVSVLAFIVSLTWKAHARQVFIT